MRKVIEIAYCDIDIARGGPSAELVTATQLDCATPDGSKDMCDTCWKEYAELFLAFVSPENALEGQAQAPLAVEAAPRPAPVEIPEPGTPEYTAGMRAFADAQTPPIRYDYGKDGKRNWVYNPKLRKLYADNLERLRQLQQ